MYLRKRPIVLELHRQLAAMKKNLILVTNDDGVDAPGLLALKQSLEKIASVIVLAPDHNWSAAGHTKTLNRPLRVWQKQLRDGSTAYVTDGAPTDCVALVMLGLFRKSSREQSFDINFAGARDDLRHEKPAMIVSGINPGSKLAHDLTYSGTVAAAMEGAINNIPSLAISLDGNHRDAMDFAPAAEIAQRLARRALELTLPPDTFLNVNVPNVPTQDMRGVRVTRLGKRIYRDALVERQDPSGKNYYWIGGEPPGGVMEDGTDVAAIAQNYVSITPVHLDMTSHALIDSLKAWENDSLL